MLATDTTLGKAAASFILRVGRPTGPGSAVTFTRVIPGGLAIPDGAGTGVTDSLTIDQDLVIADLGFQVDELVHPFVGNVSIELKGPGGFGADLINLPGVCGQRQCDLGNYSGDNFVNTRIDDSSVNDLLAAGPSAAPFSGDWLPAFNSPSLAREILPTPVDPVGQPSHFNGTSTRGDWKVHVVDSRTTNAGTLNRWSLIVRPQTFSCGP